MARQKGSRVGGRTVIVGGLLFALLPQLELHAQQNGRTVAISDAQIEANVLKALAAAPELSTENIQSSTVYGTVTLTGNVKDEAKRSRAENLVARAPGVQKVVDELTLGATTASAGGSDGPQTSQDDNQQPVLQSDGTYAPPAPAQPATPYEGRDGGSAHPAPPGYVNGQEAYGQPQAGTEYAPGSQPGYGSQPEYGSQPGSAQQRAYGQPSSDNHSGYGQPGAAQAPYGSQQTYPPQQPYNGQQPYPPQQPDYGQANGPAKNGQGQAGASGYPPQGYPSQPQQPYPGNQGYGAQGGYAQPYSPQGGYAGPQGGQRAGVEVIVPDGALLRVRINRGLDSNHIAVGAPFDGTVLSDVAADGQIAIPRGATVQGVVIDAKKAGALKGEGQLALQLTNVTLGGVMYPLNSDVWQREGNDKTVRTVNSALGLGALGAIIGGVAGGGAGAAIGAGVGAGAGVAGSAASPGGRIIVPPEAVLTFHVAQPAAVRTVSEGEMQRLAYAAGPGNGARPVVQRRYQYGYPPPPPPPGYYPY